MEELNYRELVKKIIEKHASERSEADANNAQIVFDTERDRYLLLYNGNLPPGVNFCEWEEFNERFNTNLKRQKMIKGLELAMSQLKAAGCRTIYINGSFVTSKPDPNDFDACYDRETVDFENLIVNAPRFFNHYDRNAQKAKYKGEIFPADQPVGNYGDNSFDFFQKDRNKNKKGIIAIDITRWER